MIENIIKLLAIFQNKVNTGVLEDTRPEKEKDKDFTVQEILPVKGVNVASLKTIPNGYKLRNQANSGSCVAQSGAKMLEVIDTESDEAWSATPIYSSRVNKPQGGMIGVDMFEILRKIGSAYEKDIPSQLMSDAQMDNYSWFKDQLRKDKITNYFIISDRNGNVNFENLVNAILTYKTAVIYVNASISEWNRVPQTHISNGTLRHGVACVDVIQYKNKPYVIIEDSWGILNRYYNQVDVEFAELVNVLKEGQRALSKEFIEKHCYFAGSPLNFTYYNAEPTVKNYKFNTILEFGQTNKDVALIQDKLKSLGLFPQNIPSTGYYGNITAKAIYAFQVKYNVAPLNELDVLKGKRVGSKTLAKLNDTNI